MSSQGVSDVSEETSADGFDQLLGSISILVVDDEPGMRNFLQRALTERCAMLEVAGSAEEGEALRLRYHFDLLIVDIRLPGLSGLEWVHQLRERGVRTHVIYMTAYADLEMAISALRNGADDFILKPFRMEQVLASMRLSIQRRQIMRENSLLRLQLEQLKSDRGVIGDSGVMQQTLETAQRVSPTNTTVLIEGETGVGKELLARSIHEMSKRDGAFVAINCGTIQPELFESELFGHIKGAFAGAHQARDGLFIFANGGTLFLDEIGEMPLGLQIKLLRVLEEKVVRQVGSEREIPVNVRVIAATNRDLLEQTRDDGFRKDLFYRLNVMPIKVPPLRDRIEDLPALVEYFFDLLSAEMRLPRVELHHNDYVRLQRYRWPGNIRELKNVVERTLLLGRLPMDDFDRPGGVVDLQPGYPLSWRVDEVERAHMQSVLSDCGNNKSEAARRLGVSRKTLERKQHLWARLDKEQAESRAVNDAETVLTGKDSSPSRDTELHGKTGHSNESGATSVRKPTAKKALSNTEAAADQ